MKTFLKIAGLALAFVVGAMIGSTTGSPVASFAFGGITTAVHALQTGIVNIKMFQLPLNVLASSIDISALATALGAYHREHRDELVAEILLDEDFTQDLEVMDDVTDELPLPSLALTDLIKPANATTFSPTANALAFGARTLKVRGIKVDLQLIPQVMEKTWLGKMKKSTDPWDLPFEAFIMQYINSKIKENLRLQAIYKGVYNAAGTTPVTTMDGFLKLIADEITATTIAPIVTGAITSTNVVDKLELTYDGLGDAYKGVPTIMKVNSQIFDWYNRKYRTDFGSNQDYKGMQRMRRPLDGTLCELVREPGLGTSQRVITSVKENFVYGVDSANGYSLDVQKFDRTLKVLIDFKAGVNFKEINARALAVNDQV
jgi:hypothetical protein